MSLDDAIIGRTLAGRFRVTGFIGEGAMASVYRAVQEAEPHDVALKIMRPELVTDATFTGRFRREAKAAARIEHPNTARILDTGADGKLLYIAMELLAGQDLFELLVLEKRLSEKRAATVLVQIADALSAAHAKGIVHRDLKPENIMLVDDPGEPGREMVKVLDFGIAKTLEADTPSSDGPNSMPALTGVGTVVGTPAYMSPEQCRGEVIDARSDVYACGVLLYQLVSGRLPFSGNSMEIAVSHVRSPPPPLAEIVPAIHPELWALIEKALSKWPAQRQQSAAELRDELSDLLPRLSDERLELSAAAMQPAVADPPRRASQEAITLRPSDSDDRPTAVDLRSADAAGEVSTMPAEATPLVPSPRLKPGPVTPRLPELAPRRKGNPTTGPIRGRTSVAPRSPARSWLLVPLSLVIGIAMGALAFLLSRR